MKFGNVKNKVMRKKAMTQDEQFEALVTRFKQLSKRQAVVYKVVLKQEDAIRAIAAPATTLSYAMGKIYGDGNAQGYCKVADTIELALTDHTERYKDSYNYITHHVSGFKEIKQRITERDNALIDMEAAQRELDTLECRIPPYTEKIIAAAKSKVDGQKAIFEGALVKARKEMTEFIENKQPYFDQHINLIAVAHSELYKTIHNLTLSLMSIPPEFSTLPFPVPSPPEPRVDRVAEKIPVEHIPTEKFLTKKLIVEKIQLDKGVPVDKILDELNSVEEAVPDDKRDAEIVSHSPPEIGRRATEPEEPRGSIWVPPVSPRKNTEPISLFRTEVSASGRSSPPNGWSPAIPNLALHKLPSTAGSGQPAQISPRSGQQAPQISPRACLHPAVSPRVMGRQGQ